MKKTITTTPISVITLEISRRPRNLVIEGGSRLSLSKGMLPGERPIPPPGSGLSPHPGGPYSVTRMSAMRMMMPDMGLAS
jgi:hypothetical protein